MVAARKAMVGDKLIILAYEISNELNQVKKVECDE